MKKTNSIIITLLMVSFFVFNACKDDSSNDNTPPIINIIGDSTVYVGKDSVYTDLGATATDEMDGDITSQIQIINPVNTSITGNYQVKYNVSDKAGNAALEKIRVVNVMVLK